MIIKMQQQIDTNLSLVEHAKNTFLTINFQNTKIIADEKYGSKGTIEKEIKRHRNNTSDNKLTSPKNWKVLIYSLKQKNSTSLD